MKRFYRFLQTQLEKVLTNRVAYDDQDEHLNFTLPVGRWQPSTNEIIRLNPWKLAMDITQPLPVIAAGAVPYPVFVNDHYKMLMLRITLSANPSNIRIRVYDDVGGSAYLLYTDLASSRWVKANEAGTIFVYYGDIIVSQRITVELRNNDAVTPIATARVEVFLYEPFY